MHFIDIRQLDFIHHTLRQLLGDIEAEFGVQVITSLYRMGDTGVHGTLPLRGADLRCRNNGLGLLIAKWVNERWQYDPARPELKTAIAHSKDTGFHIHLQVHPKTHSRG